MARVETTTHAGYYAPGLREVYYSTLRDLPREARQLFKFLPERPSPRSGLNYIDDILLSSLGTFQPKAQGNPIQYDVPNLSSTIRMQPYTFALGFRMTMEADADDIYGPMKEMSRQLAFAAAHQHEVQAHRMLNGGFATTGGNGFRATGFDGLALFSASHTLLKSSSTRPNKLATDEDLSVSAVEHAQDALEQWVNHSGMPMPRKGEVLVVGPQLKWVAKEICESELHPYTGNNGVNPVGGEGFKYFVDHYFTDTDQWFLLSAKAFHDLKVWMRQEPRFVGPGDDFDTGDMKWKGVFRQAEAYNEPDGIFGSQGA